MRAAGSPGREGPGLRTPWGPGASASRLLPRWGGRRHVHFTDKEPWSGRCFWEIAGHATPSRGLRLKSSVHGCGHAVRPPSRFSRGRRREPRAEPGRPACGERGTRRVSSETRRAGRCARSAGRTALVRVHPAAQGPSHGGCVARPTRRKGPRRADCDLRPTVPRDADQPRSLVWPWAVRHHRLTTRRTEDSVNALSAGARRHVICMGPR